MRYEKDTRTPPASEYRCRFRPVPRTRRRRGRPCRHHDRRRLTNGAFYTHFESKEDLVRAVLLNAQSGREKTLLEPPWRPAPGLEAAIRDYLSPRHRDNPGGVARPRH